MSAHNSITDNWWRSAAPLSSLPFVSSSSNAKLFSRTPHSLSPISRAKMFCGQDQRSDLCGARTHDYCLSAGKQQPPTAQATPTGTPAPLHTHSKTLEKLLQLEATQNNIAKQELFWKWPNINKHQGVVIWAKQTFLTTFKSSSNTLPKREEILST